MSAGAFLSVMDPPWAADAGGGGKGAGEHYPLASVEAIAAAVRLSGHWRDAGPALCWMWATSSAFIAGDAHALANRLGLRIAAGFIWAKVDDGNGVIVPPARMGLGQWSRCEHEHLLVCRRGEFDVSVPPPGTRARSVIYAPRGAHSAKPAEAWAVIETTSRSVVGPVRGVEFFCRSPRPGWTGWGHINGAAGGAVTIEG